MPSLKEYAAADTGRGGVGCMTCAHPERQQIDEALRSNYSAGVISRWLKAEGMPFVSDGAIQNHRRSGHHERATA